ncbi:hypothetical protein, partial [Vibrio cholerae]|uniref:hypothetical protein n=1 Tax=Vibrio cholerae TaxID=666 RepID=UPI001C122DF8
RQNLMFKKIFLPVLIASALSLTACSSDSIEKDGIPDLSQEALHSKARQYMAVGDFGYGARGYYSLSCDGTVP